MVYTLFQRPLETSLPATDFSQCVPGRLSTPEGLVLLPQRVASKRGAKAAAVLEAVQAASKEDSHAARMRGPGEAAQRPLPPSTRASPAAANPGAPESEDAAEADMWHDDPLESEEEHVAEQAGFDGAAVLIQQVGPHQTTCTKSHLLQVIVTCT